ncbi:MAG: cytochrome c3 family protein [Nitrospiria bacterium]
MAARGLGLVFYFLFVIGSAADANASSIEEVYDTRHNLAVPTQEGQNACALCHIDAIPWQTKETKDVEHKKALPPPLWDRERMSFSPYRTTQTVPLDEHPYNHPTGPSLVCLACHDGALGTDMHGINVDDPRIGASTDLAWKGMAGPRMAPPLSRVDHPISIPYPRKPNGVFVPLNPTVTRSRYWALPDRHAGGLTLPTSDTSSYLDLPKGGVSSPESLSTLVRTTSGKMECDSCHNPHSEQIRPFLRVPSATLCLVCHDR